MKRLRLSALFAFLLAFALVLPAGAITSASYIPMTITESSGTARTNLALTAAINNSTLATNNYIAANGLNTAVTAHEDVAGTPLAHMVATDRTNFYVAALGANGELVQDYQLGYTPAQSNMTIIPGQTGQIGITDAAALEPGAGTWEVSAGGYFNKTSSSGTYGGSVIEKPGAFKLYHSAFGVMTGIVYAAGTTTQTEVPISDIIEGTWNGGYNGAGCTQTTQYVCFATSADSKYVVATATTNVTSTFNVTAFAGAVTSSVSGVQVGIRYADGSAANGACVTPGLILYGVTVSGTEACTTSAAFGTSTQTITRPGGGSWGYLDLLNLTVSVSGRAQAAGGNLQLDYVTVTPTYYNTVAATVDKGFSSGTHTFALGTDATNLYITIDAGAQTTTPKATVVNTALDWRLQDADVIPYATAYQITIAGVTQGLYPAPTTIVTSAALPDISGQSHPGTFQWAAAGTNPTGVTVSLGSITPTTPNVAPASVAETLFGGITGTPVPPPNLFFPTPSSALPILPILVATNNSSFAPIQALYLLIVVGSTAALGFFVWSKTRHPIPMALAMIVLLSIWGVSGLIPVFFVFLFAFFAFGIAMAMARA